MSRDSKSGRDHPAGEPEVASQGASQLPRNEHSSTSGTRRVHGLKRVVFSLALAICILLVCLIVLEIVYREARGIPLGGKLYRLDDKGSHRYETFRKSADDLLIYEPIPNVHTRYTEVGTDINSHGMRDREYAVQKPPGTFRIAVLGDSIAWGFGFEVEDIFPKQLEKKLNAAGDKTHYEVLNFAVPGYSTQQETEWYRINAGRFHPDLILVAFCLNDETQASGEVLLFNKGYLSMVQKSYFVDLLRHFALHYLGIWSGIHETNYHTRTNVAEEFSRLKKVAGDARVLVDIFPYFVDFSSYPYLKQHKRIANAATLNGLLVLDLFDAYKRYPYLQVKRERNWDNVHPNKLGHEVAADATLSFLIENHVIGDSSSEQTSAALGGNPVPSSGHDGVGEERSRP